MNSTSPAGIPAEEKMKEEFFQMFSKRLKALREMNGLTQKELANEVGLTLRTIQNYELGLSMPKSKSTVARISEYFQVPISSLFEPEDFYVMDAEEKGGQEAGAEMRILLSDMTALFAGGTLSDEDKDMVMQTMNDLYWGKNKKRHYHRKSEPKMAAEHDQ